MSVAEMKKTIIQKVEELSEQQLNELNLFIDKINAGNNEEIDLLKHVDSIMSERADVLRKLAQ